MSRQITLRNYTQFCGKFWLYSCLKKSHLRKLQFFYLLKEKLWFSIIRKWQISQTKSSKMKENVLFELIVRFHNVKVNSWTYKNHVTGPFLVYLRSVSNAIVASFWATGPAGPLRPVTFLLIGRPNFTRISPTFCHNPTFSSPFFHFELKKTFLTVFFTNRFESSNIQKTLNTSF